MERSFIEEELLEPLKNLSDEDKKWILLSLVFLIAGEDGFERIVDEIGKMKENKIRERTEYNEVEA